MVGLGMAEGSTPLVKGKAASAQLATPATAERPAPPTPGEPAETKPGVSAPAVVEPGSVAAIADPRAPVLALFEESPSEPADETAAPAPDADPDEEQQTGRLPPRGRSPGRSPPPLTPRHSPSRPPPIAEYSRRVRRTLAAWATGLPTPEYGPSPLSSSPERSPPPTPTVRLPPPSVWDDSEVRDELEGFEQFLEAAEGAGDSAISDPPPATAASEESLTPPAPAAVDETPATDPAPTAADPDEERRTAGQRASTSGRFNPLVDAKLALDAAPIAQKQHNLLLTPSFAYLWACERGGKQPGFDAWVSGTSNEVPLPEGRWDARTLLDEFVREFSSSPLPGVADAAWCDGGGMRIVFSSPDAARPAKRQLRAALKRLSDSLLHGAAPGRRARLAAYVDDDLVRVERDVQAALYPTMKQLRRQGKAVAWRRHQLIVKDGQRWVLHAGPWWHSIDDGADPQPDFPPVLWS